MSLPYSVFDTMPDFMTAPRYGVANAQDVLKLASGTGRAVFHQPVTDYLFDFGFTFVGALEIDTVEEFFRQCGGTAHPFYLPSWRQDLGRATGAENAYSLTVELTDYSTKHLTDPATREDHHGRQVFAWMPGEPLFTSRVVSAAAAGTGSVLELEKPLPFALTRERGVAGFLYLARFADDEIQWKFMTPLHASAPIKFRGIRQHYDHADTATLTEIQIKSQRGFTSAILEPLPPTVRTSRMATAKGPLEIGTFESKHVMDWAAWVYEGNLRIRRGAPPATPDASGAVSARNGAGGHVTGHLSLAFAPDGSETLALETAAGVQCRHAGGVANWEGTSPVLCQNKGIGSTSWEASEMVCYYLKPGLANVFTRLQSESFGVERIAVALPFRPLQLRSTSRAGGIHTLELLDAGFRKARLVSPVFA